MPDRFYAIKVDFEWVERAKRAGEESGGRGGSLPVLLLLSLLFRSRLVRSRTFDFSYPFAGQFGLSDRRSIRKYLLLLKEWGLIDVDFCSGRVPKITIRGEPEKIPPMPPEEVE